MSQAFQYWRGAVGDQNDMNLGEPLAGDGPRDSDSQCHEARRSNASRTPNTRDSLQAELEQVRDAIEQFKLREALHVHAVDSDASPLVTMQTG